MNLSNSLTAGVSEWGLFIQNKFKLLEEFFDITLLTQAILRNVRKFYLLESSKTRKLTNEVRLQNQ